MKILNNKNQIPNQGKTGILQHSKDLLSPSQIRRCLFYKGDHKYKKQSETHLYMVTVYEYKKPIRNTFISDH